MTAIYETGTVSVTAGSAVVTGTGTGWLTSRLRAGIFGLDGENGSPVPVMSVDSDTQITLAKAWRGTTAAMQAYWITYDTQPGQQDVSNSQRLAEYIARLNSDSLAAISGLDPASEMFIMFTGPTTAILVPKSSIANGAAYDIQVSTLADRLPFDGAPGPSGGNRGFSVFVSDIGNGDAAIYSKLSNASGDWSQPAIMTGSGPEGPAGPAPDITAGPVTTLPTGSDATVTTTEIAPGVVQLSFGIPSGPEGPGGAPGPFTELIIGDTTTLPPGSEATVTVTPISPGVVELSFGLPAGSNGTGAGTVTSIGLTVPTGLEATPGAIAGAGTFVITYSAGYQGFTVAEATKLAGIEAGAQVNPTVGTTAGTVAAGNDARLNDNAKLNVEDQTLVGGARVTSKDLGTITNGTVTPDPGDRPLQHYVNNGAHSLAPGSNGGSYMLDITNGASAGAITLSGWTKTAGDAFTLTSGHKFRLHCSVGNAGSLLIVQAMQ